MAYQEKNNQYYNEGSIRLEYIDKIEDILSIYDSNEMDSKIFKNSLNISKILKTFFKKLSDNFSLTKEEIEILVYCLKFIDTLNLFMNNQSIDSILKIIREINDMINVINNLESREDIIRRIKYTEKSIIYYKKKNFKFLFFAEGQALGKEIEKCLNIINQNGIFDHKVFKQMQNIFYVVQKKIDEVYREKLQIRFNEMKAINIKNKKNFFFTEDYTDYKNYNEYKDYYDNYTNYKYDYNYEYGNNYYRSQNYYKKGYFKEFSQNTIAVDVPNIKPVENIEKTEISNNIEPIKKEIRKNSLNFESIRKNSFVEETNRKKSHSGTSKKINKEKNSKMFPTQINIVPNVIENIDSKASNEQTPINSEPDKNKNIQNYYNENFFKSYVYYYEKSDNKSKCKNKIPETKKDPEKEEDPASNHEIKENYVLDKDIEKIQTIVKENNENFKIKQYPYTTYNNYKNNYRQYGYNYNNYSYSTGYFKNQHNSNSIQSSSKYYYNYSKQYKNEEIIPFNKIRTNNYTKYNNQQLKHEFVDLDDFNFKINRKGDDKEQDNLDNNPDKTEYYENQDLAKDDSEDEEEEFEEEENEENELNDDHNHQQIENVNESSDSVDPDLIEEEFENFTKMAKISGQIFDEEDDEEKTKNNKVIFEEEDEDIKIKKVIDENNNENYEDLKASTRSFMESLKSIDPKILNEIKNKLNEDDKKNHEGEMINLNNHYINKKVPIQNYIFSNYAHFFYRGRDSNIHREYFALKCLEQDNPSIIIKNLENFENKILIPMYQRINYNVNKKKGIYFYTFTKYKKLIYRILSKDKILKKVKPYGSYMNNFLIDSGDIDICIVPKCSIIEFSTYLEKIKDEITSQNLGEHKLTHHNNRYMLLKVLDHQTRFIIDITVHNMLPILNTNLIRLYSLYDQRFHIMGLYLKHLVKINKINGAADNYISSYALLIMLIFFLQKIIEPSVLPNLQNIEDKEIIYEYQHNGENIKINIYFEEDVQKIKAYMKKINNGQENTESASELLIKFLEYFSYYYDYYEQKLSIHNNNLIKKKTDNIAFSIEDPFDKTHNPGKSMLINSTQFNKFITTFKKEINFIMNGEYVKRLEKINITT